MKINPSRSLRGEIRLPGDKSISHRAAIISAIAEGETRITNFATSADCAATLKCLHAMGVSINRDGSDVLIRGVGKNGFRKPASVLDCENSGTTMRLLSGVLAGQHFESVIDGDESLRKRPMKRIIEPLGLMNARIESCGSRAPLTIFGQNPLRPIDFQPEIASAQLKSCIMLAGLNADGETTVLEKVPTRDHTERMLRWFGVDVAVTKLENGVKIGVSGDAKLTANDFSVPGDVSSAAFFLVAAAFLNGSEIKMPNVGVNPTRSAILDVLQSFGADIEIVERAQNCNEPVATLIVKGSGGNSVRSWHHVLQGKVIANLIDEIPILAVAGTQLEGGLEIRDASELRIKESDRIAAIVENLRRMGASVEEFDDGFRVDKSDLKGSIVDSFGDHRIAMAFAVAGLFAVGETEIVRAECTSVSYPEFFETLGRVVR